MNIFKIIVLIVVFGYVIFPAEGIAQEEKDTISKLIVQQADNQVYDFSAADTLWMLNGDVRMSHDSTYIYSDTARVSGDYALAYGDVSLLQGDSLKIFSDSLRYMTEERMGYAIGNVILENADDRLYSNAVVYDAFANVASYYNVGMLQSGGYTLKSLQGWYHTKSGNARFRKDVTLENDSMYIKTDSLDYNVRTGAVDFLSPFMLHNDAQKIYARSGNYNTRSRTGYFTEQVEVANDSLQCRSQRLDIRDEGKVLIFSGDVYFYDDVRMGEGDTLIYDRAKNKVILKGNAYVDQEGGQYISGDEIVLDRITEDIQIQGKSSITDKSLRIQSGDVVRMAKDSMLIFKDGLVVTDTLHDIYVFGNQGTYDQVQNTFTVSDTTGQSAMLHKIDNDYIHLVADTIIVDQDVVGQDTINSLTATGKVSLWNDDFSAVSDSVFYDGRDSIFYLYDNPIAWRDSSQFSARLMKVTMGDGGMKSMTLEGNTRLINTTDFQLFSMLEGDTSIVHMKDGKVEQASMKKDVVVKYYMQDDQKRYVGLNVTHGENMVITYKDNELEMITFYGKEKSEILPMSELSSAQMNEGRSYWRYQLRPDQNVLLPFRTVIAQNVRDYEKVIHK